VRKLPTEIRDEGVEIVTHEEEKKFIELAVEAGFSFSQAEFMCNYLRAPTLFIASRLRKIEDVVDLEE